MQMATLAEHHACEVQSLAESPKPSPRSYVIRNTFIEVGGEGEVVDEEPTQPPFRRRRGSSFFRCSSEPLRVPKEAGEEQDFSCDESISSNSSSCGRSAPKSPPRSQMGAVKPRHDSQDIAYLSLSPAMAPIIPQVPPGSFTMSQRDTALSAAIQAGFNAGIQAALTMRTNPTLLQQHHGRDWQQPSRKDFACLGRGRQFDQDSKLRTHTPPGQPSSGASDASTSVSIPSVALPSLSGGPCHLIWCDNRAFKETAAPQRQELEDETGTSVKAHKSAENCIRLLRKKQNAQGRPPCVILVSWANAGALLPFLNECTNINAKVIVLSESASRKKDGLDSLGSRYPFVEKVVFQWADAVQAVGLAVAELQVAQC